ncbi:hypothetical protein WICPIJ_003064, partial [Wickerhamomyces pijperi]
FYHRDIDDPVHKGHPDYRNPGRHPDSQMQTHSRHREKEKEKEKMYRESSRLAKLSHRYVDPLLVKQKDPLGDSNFMNYLDNSTNDNLNAPNLQCHNMNNGQMFEEMIKVEEKEQPHYKRKSSKRPGHL